LSTGHIFHTFPCILHCPSMGGGRCCSSPTPPCFGEWHCQYCQFCSTLSPHGITASVEGKKIIEKKTYSNRKNSIQRECLPVIKTKTSINNQYMAAAKNKNNNQPVPREKNQVLTMEIIFTQKNKALYEHFAVPNLLGRAAPRVFLHTKTLYLALYLTAATW